jgi:hypothetical protein
VKNFPRKSRLVDHVDKDIFKTEQAAAGKAQIKAGFTGPFKFL